MSQEVIKILDDLGKRFGVAIDWTGQNVLPYVQDLLHRAIKYEIATSIFWIILFLIIAMIGIIAIRLDLKHDYIGDHMITVFGVIIIIACFTFMCFQAFDILTALTLPEKIYFQFFNEAKSLLR